MYDLSYYKVSEKTNSPIRTERIPIWVKKNPNWASLGRNDFELYLSANEVSDKMNSTIWNKIIPILVKHSSWGV
jgi:hypothetical protein